MSLLGVEGEAIRGAGEAIRTAQHAGKALIRCFRKSLAQGPNPIERRLSIAANRVLLGTAEDLRGYIVERALGAAVLDVDADDPEIGHRRDNDIAAMGDGDIDILRKRGMSFDARPAGGARREDEAVRSERERFIEERAQQGTAGNTLIAARVALVTGRVTPIIRRREDSKEVLRAGLRKVE